jgi:hypothetical protein
MRVLIVLQVYIWITPSEIENSQRISISSKIAPVVFTYAVKFINFITKVQFFTFCSKAVNILENIKNGVAVKR